MRYTNCPCFRKQEDGPEPYRAIYYHCTIGYMDSQKMCDNCPHALVLVRMIARNGHKPNPKTLQQEDIKKVLYEKMVAMLKEVADSSTTTFCNEGDELGACIHCDRITYKGHSDTCLITKVNKLLKELDIN